MRRLCKIILLGVALCTLSGCMGMGDSEATALDLDRSAASTAPPVLQSGDKIHVAVFGEDALGGDYEIDPTGAVSLPLAGTVRAAGLTQATFVEALTTRLRAKFLRNPRVTVDIVAARPFYILGEVEKPGEYPYRNGLDIWRAMALAGGQTYRASPTTVAIQHGQDRQWRDYALSAAPAVQPGDVIRVPERWF